ncbi:MAG: hypothetical protein ACRDT0_09950 [Pseudonocardiaceae bacterium]
MAAGSDRVYGQQRVLECVYQLLTRVEPDGSLRKQRSPILVVEGFRGSGKTALLSALVDRVDQRAPYARLDFEDNRFASVPQVLSALAFALSRKCPRYGALRFPRLIVGQLVMDLKLDLNNREQACRQVVHKLKRQRGLDSVEREVLTDTAGGVLATMFKIAGVPFEPPASLLRFILERLMAWIPRWGTGFESGQEWYRHRDRGLTRDPIDELVDLNRWATDYENNRQLVDELLWAAFLADLRAEFSRSRADEWAFNCVVLLDNADTLLGRRFLTQLVQSRSQRVAGGQDDADPLTVVATSRGALLAAVPGKEQAPMPADQPRSGPLPRPADWSPYRWLPYRLPDLTEAEIGSAIADMALDWGDSLQVTRVVHQLTGGHPASTRLVLDAIARLPAQEWIDPEVILGEDARSENPATVEEQLLAHLLGDPSHPALWDLVTCAAAREQEQALGLTRAGQDGALVSGQVDYGEVLDPILWPPEKSAGPILLSRLLRRRLALRAREVSPNWSEVYSRLRHTCLAGDDEVCELYYALADGELGFVTRRLHQRLTELRSTAWCDLLTSVTEAPRQHRHRQAPIDEVATLMNSAALEQPLTSVGQLVAGLWIAADPFTDSRRRYLHQQIAADYAAVSGLSPGGPHVVFLETVNRHRREAEWWD